MAETLRSIVKEARRNKYSLTKKLSEDDIIAIWDGASEFIEKQMLQQKGTAVPGLGVFTFSQKKIEVGNNKFTIQRPVFVLSEKLVQTHSLHVTRQHTSGQIPIVPLNFTYISNDSLFNRDTVEVSFKDVLLALSRALATSKNIQVDFGKVGRLLISNGKVKMRFFRNFIVSLDTSGGVERAFRPNTANSVLSIMSNPTCLSPRQAFTTPILPKIVEPSGEDAELYLGSNTPRPVSGGSSVLSKLDEFVIEPDDSVSQRGRDSASCNEKLAPLKIPLSGRHSLVPAPGSIFSANDHPLTSSISSSEDQPTSVQLQSSSPTSNKSTTSKKAKEGERQFTSPATSRPSDCSHSSTSGQELCYICHQRAWRNVPVDVSKERREREKLNDQMLNDYRYQKDLVSLAKDLILKSNDRAYSRRIASLNLEMARTQQDKKISKSSEFCPSYLFSHRESTPAKYLKQTEYSDQLDSQVSHTLNRRQRLKQLEERLGKEEQIKLTEELTKDQKEYSKRKLQKMLQYQRALAEQTKLKPTQKELVMKQPLFAVEEGEFSADKQSRQKERSKKLFMEQLQTANAKKELAEEKIALEKEEGKEMLKRTRKGLVEDMRADKCHNLALRRDLEKSWCVHITEKQQRQLEELAHSEQPSILLQRQCDNYLRCDQCQKARANMGKSNLLAETRYISGSRLMV